MSLGSIIVRLVMNTADFDTDTKRAASIAEKRSKEISASFNKAGVAIGAALGTAVTAVGFAVKSAIDHADRLNDMNQRLGVSAEALSGWGYAATQTGTDLDALGIGLKKLAKNMVEAMDPKSAQAGFFKSLGIEITDASGRLREVEDVLPEIASKFKQLDNATLESALAMDLFGKSGTDLLEFLNQGDTGLAELRDRARELGVEISGPTMAAADQFNDTLADIKTITEGLALRLAEALLPSLQDTADIMRDGAQAGGEFGGIFDFIRDQAQATVKDIEFFVETGQELVALWEALNKPLGGPALKRWEQKHQFDNVVGGSQTSQRQGRFSAEYEAASLNFNPGTTDLEARLNRAYGGTPSKAKKSGESEAEKLAKQAAKAAEEAEEAQRRWNSTILDMEAALAGPVAEVQREYARNIVELNAEFNAGKVELSDYAKGLELYAEARDKELAAIAARKTPAQEMLADMEFERLLLGKTREEQDLLTAARYLGVEAMTAQGRAALDAMADNQKATKAMNQQVEAMNAFRQEGSNLLQDLAAGVEPVDALTNALDGLAAKLQQMIADNLMEKFFGQMGSASTGSAGGGVWDWLGGLFGSFLGGGTGGGGAATSSSPAMLSWMQGGYSRGGYTGAGGMFEPAGTVHKGEVVWSKGDVARAGGVANVEAMRHGNSRRSAMPAVININVPANTSYDTAAQAGQAAYAGAGRAARRNG